MHRFAFTPPLRLRLRGLGRGCAIRIGRLQERGRAYSTINDLLAQFRNPSSPFYLAPGEKGPDSPGPGFGPEVGSVQYSTLAATPTNELEEGDGIGSESEAWKKTRRLEGEEHLANLGFDTTSFHEQPIVWGDLDSFRHVNNVRYLRFLESARLNWILTLGHTIGSLSNPPNPSKAKHMLSGKGISVILKEISVKFKRPVLFPDTLLIAHKPHDPHPTHFSCAAAIWSFDQQRIVATSDSVLVWYDYDALQKCDPGPTYRDVIEGRIRAVQSRRQ